MRLCPESGPCKRLSGENANVLRFRCSVLRFRFSVHSRCSGCYGKWSHINTTAAPCPLTGAQTLHTTLSHLYSLVFALGKEEKTLITTADGPASGVRGTAHTGMGIILPSLLLTFPLTQAMVLCWNCWCKMVILHDTNRLNQSFNSFNHYWKISLSFPDTHLFCLNLAFMLVSH